MTTKKNFKTFNEMKNTNIFFCECSTDGILEEQLKNFRKYLQKLAVCYETNFRYEAIEFLMWLYEFSYSSKLFLCTPEDFKVDNFFETLKQICYTKRDLYDLYLSFDHIADIRKYYSLHVNIIKDEDGREKLNNLVYCIIEYMHKQYKEAKDYVSGTSGSIIVADEKYLLDICKERLEKFWDAEPSGNWKPEEVFVHRSNLEITDKKENVNLQDVAKKFLSENSLMDVYNHINEYVYKQEDAKRVMSLMFYNHMQRLANPEADIDKRNFLLIGPTGCGKTEITRAINKISPVPVITLDCSCITGTGWRGASFGDLIYTEYESFSDSQKELFSGSFIVLDEFDKLVKHSAVDEQNFQFDKQTAILKALEDRKITVSETKFTYCPEMLDASNVTFILAGAFYGLFEEDEFSVSLENNNDKDSQNNNLTEALIKFGFMHELAGRISSSVQLQKLNTQDLVHILKYYKNSAVKKAQNLYDLSGIKVTITPKAIEAAAEIANERGLGARGANNVLNAAIDKEAFDAIKNKAKEIKINKKSLGE